MYVKSLNRLTWSHMCGLGTPAAELNPLSPGGTRIRSKLLSCGKAVQKPVDNSIQVRITARILWITKKLSIIALDPLRCAWLRG